MKCCIMEKLKLFCVYVFGVGWGGDFLCNTDDNILAFFILKGKSLQTKL